MNRNELQNLNNDLKTALMSEKNGNFSVFETSSFSRSDTSPCNCNCLRQRELQTHNQTLFIPLKNDLACFLAFHSKKHYLESHHKCQYLTENKDDLRMRTMAI